MANVIIELNNGTRLSCAVDLERLNDDSEFVTVIRPDGKEIQLNKGAIVVVYEA